MSDLVVRSDRYENAARNIRREGLRALEGAATPRIGAYARGKVDAAGDGTSSPATARSMNRERISGRRQRSNPGPRGWTVWRRGGMRLRGYISLMAANPSSEASSIIAIPVHDQRGQ